MIVKNDTRPINVGISDLLFVFKWPLPALTSIAHRISGVVLFVGIAFALYALDVSLASDAGFGELKEMMASPFSKFVIWGLLSALAFHFVAGIKHLLLDMGVGETLEGAAYASKVVIVLSAILIFLAAAWVI